MELDDNHAGERDKRTVPTIGHLMSFYLARSETFIYTLLKFQTEFRPVVLARSTVNLNEFPFEPIFNVGATEPRFENAIVQKLIMRARGYLKTYERKLSRSVHEAGCVALHAHFAWSALANLRGARELGLPLITTVYGRDIPTAPSPPMDALFQQGSHFICEGPVMGERLRALGCPPDKIRLVPIGIDFGQFEFKLRDRESPFIILQSARFVEKKGVDLSIRALAAVRRSLPSAELWLVGDGDLRPELEALAAKLGISDCVRFLGMMSHADYLKLANRVHAGIQPSRIAADGDSEGGAPTVILEMQACGIPVVATRHADIPFVVPDPDQLVPEEDVDGLASAIIELATISDLEYQHRAERGREFVEQQHDARIVATHIAAVYREALHGSGTALA